MSVSATPFITPALGHPIPNSLHACISSLPTFRDVCGYEEKEPRVIHAMQTGYPRFFTHPLIARCQELARKELAREGETVSLVFSRKGLQGIESFLKDNGWLRTVEWEGTIALLYPEGGDEAKRVHAFLQHTGCRISSRWAEHILVQRRLISGYQEEKHSPNIPDAEQEINRVMQEMFPEVPAEYLFLANSGMNAFYAVFRFLQKRSVEKGRRRWLQIGWLYLDTMEILKKFIPQDQELVVVQRPGNTEELLKILNETPNEWAGIIGEFPSNPLLECFDLERISEWSRKHDVPLVVDPTIVTAWNVQLFPYADIVVTSFTKYAASEGDVMSGAVAINPDYVDAQALAVAASAWMDVPFQRDLTRLGAQIGNMRGVTRLTGENNRRFVQRLKADPRVEKVLFVEEGPTAHHYEKVKRPGGGPGSMVTVVFRNPKPVYDALRMYKGPSFGLKFSLCCPFLYLAHYDLVTNPEGRKHLIEAGLAPELIRFSIGVEPFEELWERMEEALAQGSVNP